MVTFKYVFESIVNELRCNTQTIESMCFGAVVFAAVIAYMLIVRE